MVTAVFFLRLLAGHHQDWPRRGGTHRPGATPRELRAPPRTSPEGAAQTERRPGLCRPFRARLDVIAAVPGRRPGLFCWAPTGHGSTRGRPEGFPPSSLLLSTRGRPGSGGVGRGLSLLRRRQSVGAGGRRARTEAGPAPPRRGGLRRRRTRPRPRGSSGRTAGRGRRRRTAGARGRATRAAEGEGPPGDVSPH